MRRCDLNEFPCFVPANIDEALAQKAEINGLLPIAGGTEVMVLMNEGLMPPTPCQPLHRLRKSWRYIRTADDGGLRIGPLTTYTDVRFHPYIREKFPLLVQAAKVTGAVQIQNLGTLAGNIVNGSPAADMVPSLMVYEARLRLLGKRGERLINLSEFFTGYRKNVLESDEYLSEIIIPPTAFPPANQYYLKVGTRAAQAISKVVFAGARIDGLARLSWGSVAPTTIRSLKTEEAIQQGAAANEAWEILDTEIKPIDDIRSTAGYRRLVSRRILADFLQKTTV